MRFISLFLVLALVGCVGSTPRLPQAEDDLEVIESEAYHEIQPRETLYGIARMYKTTVHALLDLNPGVDPKVLPIGYRLRIPAGKAAVRAVESIEDTRKK